MVEKKTKTGNAKKETTKVETKKETQKKIPAAGTSSFDPYQIIKSPLSTEKSLRQIEYDNKLVFVVNPKATKADVKRAVEELFKVKVISVNLQNSFVGEKRAYVKLSPASLASDVAADLGLI